MDTLGRQVKTEVDGIGGYLTSRGGDKRPLSPEVALTRVDEPGTGGRPGQGLTLAVVVLPSERSEAPRDCETPALNLITGSADQRQNGPRSDAALVKGKSAELPPRAATRRQWPLHQRGPRQPAFDVKRGENSPRVRLRKPNKRSSV